MSRLLIVFLSIIGLMFWATRSAEEKPTKVIVLPPNKKVINVNSTYARPFLVACRDMREGEKAEEYVVYDDNLNVWLTVKEVKNDNRPRS